MALAFTSIEAWKERVNSERNSVDGGSSLMAISRVGISIDKTRLDSNRLILMVPRNHLDSEK